MFSCHFGCLLCIATRSERVVFVFVFDIVHRLCSPWLLFVLGSFNVVVKSIIFVVVIGMNIELRVFAAVKSQLYFLFLLLCSLVRIFRYFILVYVM